MSKREGIGKGTPGPGRPKGVPNKATAAVREAFAAFVEGNMHRVQELFDRVAEDDPAKALDILDRLAAYTTPKMKSIEHTGEAPPIQVVEVRLPPKDGSDA